MSESEYANQLITAGWDKCEAYREAHEKYLYDLAESLKKNKQQAAIRADAERS